MENENPLREERIRELAELIAARVRALPAPSPQGPNREPTRRYYMRRIRWLAESYGLAWMIDQATLGHRLDALGDDDLALLLRDMEAGRRCIVEGGSLDEAGLVHAVGDR